MSIPEFGEMIARHSAALIGSKELFDEGQVRTFGLVESGETPWGWLHIYRKFEGTSTAASYFLVVKDKDAKELKRFRIETAVIADAISFDLSVIAHALSRHPTAVIWIAEKLEPQFHAKVERIRLSMEASITETKGGGSTRV
ncbi:MAG: hypothetical protein WCK08_07175 [Betaproteobacteria bacterium]|jgi:hypothetical protein